MAQQQVATFFPSRINSRVPNMEYAAEVEHSAPFRCNLLSPVALDADGILAAQSIATAGSSATFDAAYSETAMGRWGRAVSIVLSGAGTPTVDIRGRDYLNQPIRETLTGNGTTPVNGAKCFKAIDSVTWTLVAATTMNVGWINRLGLPFKVRALIFELKNGIVAANAGSITAGSDAAQTATTTDPRGYYTPATVLPDGTNTFEQLLELDKTNLHGLAHFYS